MTQKALAELAGVSQGTISKIEHGIRLPTTDEVARLAAALRVNVTFFDRAPDLRFVGVPALFRLRRSNVAQSAVEQLNAEMMSRAMHLAELQRTAQVTPKLPMPHAVEGDAPEVAALRLRSSWLVRPGPLHNLTALCEAAGIYVVELDLDVPGFDGALFRAPDLPVAIFVRRDQPPDRRRVTIAHELGHLVLHSEGVPGTKEFEQEAYRFAQELLAPAADIRRRFGRSPDLNWLRQLKREWHLSLAFLVMRAHSLGIISDRRKTSLFQSLGMLGWRVREPEELPAERPQLFAQTLQFVVESLGYTADDLALALGELPERVISMYGLGRGAARAQSHLRIV